MHVIAQKRDPVTFCDLDSSGLPSGIEAVNVVLPNAVALDADVSTIALDADLAIVMNVAVAHAAANPDADPSTAVQAYLAVLDSPSGAFARVDRSFLRNARIFLDSYVPDQDVARHAFERKGGDGGLNLAVPRIIGEIDVAVGIIEIEFVTLETGFTQYLKQRLIVNEHTFR